MSERMKMILEKADGLTGETGVSGGWPSNLGNVKRGVKKMGARDSRPCLSDSIGQGPPNSSPIRAFCGGPLQIVEVSSSMTPAFIFRISFNLLSTFLAFRRALRRHRFRLSRAFYFVQINLSCFRMKSTCDACIFYQSGREILKKG